MATNTRKLALGVLLLVVSSIVILAAGFIDSAVPAVLAGVAALGMAGGSLLVGLSEDGAGV